MPAENKFIQNQTSTLNSEDFFKSIQIGVVVSVDDPESLGRIKVKIPGQPNMGGDDGTSVENLPWCYPMGPKFFSSIPKVNEGVFVLIHNKQKTHSDRLYFGPIISQLDKLDFDPVNTTALSSFSFATNNPNPNFNRIPALKGVFADPSDITIQGRYNTDAIFKRNEVLIRAGKFVESTPNENNPYSFEFNRTTQAFIQIKNNANLEKPTKNKTTEVGSITNIVANKINLITHKNGSPRFNVPNQENMISDEEMLNILENAHPLPFGDLQLQYLRLLKNAFLNHVHNGTGPATDLTAGGATQDVLKFKTAAEDLENRMLSKNIRIN